MYKLKMSKEDIRKQIQLKPQNWRNTGTTNCYAYALGLDIKENDICQNAYQPGTMSKILNLSVFFEYFFYSTLIKNIEKDFEKLGILYKEIEPNDKINENEWKVALFIENCGEDIEDDDLLIADFRFLRANSDGIWRHKDGYHSQPTKKDYSGKIITNLESCDLSYYEYKKCYALRLNK